MAITNVLTTLPVTNFEEALIWYARFFGRAPDNRPMDGLAEWQLTDTGGVQVFDDPGNAGAAAVTIAVDDLEAHVAGLERVGAAVSPITSGEMARFATVRDPDGNTMTFAEPR